MTKGIRVNQLAKELGIESKAILARCREEGLGDKVPNHMSVLSVALANKVLEWFGGLALRVDSSDSENVARQRLGQPASINRLVGLLNEEKLQRQLRNAVESPNDDENRKPAIIESILRTEIAAKLELPAQLTMDDILDTFGRNFRHANGDFATAYAQFRRDLVGPLLSLRETRPLATAVLRADDVVMKPLPLEPFWTGGQGVAISIHDTGPAEIEKLVRRALKSAKRRRVSSSAPMSNDVVLYIKAKGAFSDAALKQVEKELGPLLRSLMFSPVDRIGQLTCMRGKDVKGTLKFVAQCLNSYYANLVKGDSMDRRLRNAMLLLVEADRQKHPAVALSLCFSAMEAMLGEGDGKIVGPLSEYIATLLRADRLERPDEIKRVKSLYGVRSKVLHGVSLDHEAEALTKTRNLSHEVLGAVVTRRELDRKLEQRNGAPVDFFNELRHAFQTGSPFFLGRPQNFGGPNNP